MQYKGKEQTHDAALKIVFKISEQKASQADILRTPSNLLSDLEKVVCFDPIEHDKNENLEEDNQKINLNNGCFFARVINNHKESHCQKRLMQYYVAVKLLHHVKSYRRIQKIIKTLMLLRLLLWDDDKHLQEKDKRKLTKQNQGGANELQNLIHQRHASLKLIQQRQWIILNSRHTHIKRVMQALKKTGNIPLLVGMTYENQVKFLNGYFSLKEREVSKLPHIKEKMAWVTLQQVKVLGDNTGNLQVNTQVSDDYCLVKLQDFENDEAVKKPLEDHLAIVIEQTQLLHEDKKALADIDKQLNDILDTMNSQEEISLSDSEKALLESIDMTEFEAALADLDIDIDCIVDAQSDNKPTLNLQNP
ncbi:MAG: hypothetical protein AB7I18_12730 [Candidatus Berkiella sp.]